MLDKVFCWLSPDKLDVSLGDMLRSNINYADPTIQAALRALLVLSIDSKCLELAKAQRVNSRNLVQIAEDEGTQFLGAMK